MRRRWERQPSELVGGPQNRIPAEATAIHGITTDEVRAHGRPAAEAIGEIVEALARALAAGIAVVAYNASFDFTVLDRECRRYGLQTLEDQLHRPTVASDTSSPLATSAKLAPAPLSRSASRSFRTICSGVMLHSSQAHAWGSATT
jgi:DNA polymerase-3 subunit epsilon